MAGFDIWDIVKVPFPHTNRPVRQHRPALVVAQYSGPGAPALRWVLMITSVSHRRWEGDIEITDTAMAGLPAPSIVRCAKIATIETAEADRIGVLPAVLRTGVSHILASMLATHREKGSPHDLYKTAR